MRYLLSAFSFLIISSCYAQQAGTPVLFISNHDSNLFIDGVEISPLPNNAPYKIYLNPGDHVVQAKTDNEILSQTVSCSDTKQIAVSFNFTGIYTKSIDAGSSNPAEQLVLHDLVTFKKDVVRNLSTTENKYFSFDVNDRIKFDLKTLQAESLLNLYIYSYPDNRMIYSKENISEVNDSFTVVRKGVYYFSMTNNNVVKTPGIVKITRIPGAGSRPNFKTSVISRPDTTFTIVSGNTYTLKTERLSVPINIPADSRFWVYWIGVGNEAIINYDNYDVLYAEGKSGDDRYPVYAFGTGKSDGLTKVKSSYAVNYAFADKFNSKNFMEGKQYDLFNFKQGKGITTDFAIMEIIKKDMQLLISTPQSSIGQKMKIVVAAFQVSENYIIDPADK